MAFPERFSYGGGEYGALRGPAERIMVGLTRMNKWGDTLYTTAWEKFGCVWLGKFIHYRIAHRMPELYDMVSDILAQRHLPNQFPPTEALENPMESLDDIFEIVVMGLDGINEALMEFIQTAHGGDTNALALQMEGVQVEVSRLYTGVLDLWRMWSTGPSLCSFDKYVEKYMEGAVK